MSILPGGKSLRSLRRIQMRLGTIKPPFGHRLRLRARHRWRGGSKPGMIRRESLPLSRIILIGNPNVGKSALFNRLTGAYAAVSNYPGTTVALDEGRCRLNGREFTVIDLPGMYSLLPITEEERVAKRLLLEARPALVLHVVDTKNLQRMLPLALQLIEAELPVMLVLNMMDEAEKLGIRVDANELEAILGIPVVPVTATTGSGFDGLIKRMNEYVAQQHDPGRL